ncbi:MAG: DUF1638 domain-containing protein [Gammaproteobacteria bacterium]|nr:DUF1638 domain-containing protein [Gammaproteobacteria bacterium]
MDFDQGISGTTPVSNSVLPGEREKPSTVVIACSALMKEIHELSRANGWNHIRVECIPAELHSRPEKIPGAVKAAIDKARNRGSQIFVAYGDCGTGGRLDVLLKAEGVERIPGAHCYEFFSGKDQFARFGEEEIGTFYLTDFLVRHFDRLVIRGLGLHEKPELEPLYFGHYRKLLYLAQTDDPMLKKRAMAAAERLGLVYEYHYSGCGGLGDSLVSFNRKLVTGSNRGRLPDTGGMNSRQGSEQQEV